MNDGNKPAFPQHVLNPNEKSYSIASNVGMTIRDYFAAQSLATVIGLSLNKQGDWDPVACAACAYQVADAMLEARKQ